MTTKPFILPRFKKLVTLVAFALLCAGSAPAQQSPGGGTGTIYGRVMDAGTNKFMPSADVTVNGTRIATTTDQGGFYTLLNVPAGDVTVSVRYAGYVTVQQTASVTAGTRVPMDFNMNLTPEIRPGVTTSGTESVVQMEKFSVSTDRAGNAKAFMEQKNAMTMSTIVATDQFGVVQGGNIAEFLKNVPGVQLNLDDDTGEAATISIGGMDSQYTAVTMNGAAVANGSGGTFDSNSRQFQFDQLSVDAIESISINKTLDASMPGDAPAGTVDLRLKSAFDRKSAALTYDLYMTMNSNAKTLSRIYVGDIPAISVLPGFRMNYSTPFNRGTMGLNVGFGAQSDYRMQGREQNSYGSDGWSNRLPYISSIRYYEKQNLNRRVNGNASFDWKISPFANMSFGVTYGWRDSTVSNKNLTIYAGGGSGGATLIGSNTLIRMNGTGSGNKVLQNGGASSYYKPGYTDTFNWRFHWARYRFQLDVNASYSYSKTEQLYSQEGYFSGVEFQSKTAFTGFRVVRSDPRSAAWHFYQSPADILATAANKSSADPDSKTAFATSAGSNKNVSDITTYGQTGNNNIADPVPSNMVETIPAASVDLRWDARTSFPLFFKIGGSGKQDKRNAWDTSGLVNHYQYVGGYPGLNTPGLPPTKSVTGSPANNNSNWDSSNQGLVDGFFNGVKNGSVLLPPGVTLDDVAPLLSSPYYQSSQNFDPHMGGNITDINFPFVNRQLLYQNYLQHPEWFYQKTFYQMVDGVGQARSQQDLNSYIASFSAPKILSETTLSGYLMGEVRPNRRIVIQAGLRYEYTMQSADVLVPYNTVEMQNRFGMSKSAATDPDKAYLYATTQYGDPARRRHVTNNYGYFLPRINFKYQFTSNFNAHLSYTESYGRIDVDKIAGTWSIDDTNSKATSPNAKLSPDHFKVYGVGLEYYFEPSGNLSLTYNIRTWNGITYDKVIVDPDSVAWQQLVDQYGDQLMGYFESANYTVWSYDDSTAMSRNIQSIELSYSQAIPFIRGLRFNAAFTRTVANWRKTGTAPRTASGGIRYSYRNLDIRLRGYWIDRIWKKWDNNFGYTSQQQLATFKMDADITLRISKQFNLYASVSNMTDEPTENTINNPSVLYQRDANGSQWRIGVKGEF